MTLPKQQPSTPAFDEAADDVLEDDDVGEAGSERGGRVATDGGDGQAHAGRENGERDPSSDHAGERSQRRIVRSQRRAVQRKGGPHRQSQEDEHDDGEQGGGGEHGDGLREEHPPAAGLPGQQRRHAARRELGAHQRGTERPADDREPPARALEDALEATSTESRIVDLDEVFGEALRRRCRRRSLRRGSTPLARRQASTSPPRCPPRLGIVDPLLVGLLRQGAAPHERRDATQGDADKGATRRSGGPAGAPRPGGARRAADASSAPSPDWSVRAKKASSRLVSTGRSSVG